MIGSNWTGATSSFSIAGDQLAVGSGETDIYWSTASFGIAQEAYVTLTTIPAGATEIGLILKAQSPSGSRPALVEVFYSPPQGIVQAWSYEPGTGWRKLGSDVPVIYGAGDRFGVRAGSDGTLEIYRNSQVVGVRSAASWPYGTSGGFIGLFMSNANGTKLDDFGGGTVNGSAPAPTPTPTGVPSGSPTPTATPTVTPLPGTPTATPVPGGYPSTGVLDNFNRANGAIGADWGGATSGYTVNNDQVSVGSGEIDIYWKGTVFGTAQEAYFTLTSIPTTAGEIGLALKSAKCYRHSAALINVLYSPARAIVQAWTYEPGVGRRKLGTDIPMTFAVGDRLGVRARVDGNIELYRNGQIIGTRNVSAWPYAFGGGYIGLYMVDAVGTVLDDFGGGTTGATNAGVGDIAPPDRVPDEAAPWLTHRSLIWLPAIVAEPDLVTQDRSVDAVDALAPLPPAELSDRIFLPLLAQPE
ncbi:MAG: hypothetical protein IPK16_05950 [Anaerolineales bacterium]|nr:hypothetical protein [Anaerolineales bacterium]